MSAHTAWHEDIHECVQGSLRPAALPIAMSQAVPAVSANFKAKGEQAALFGGVPSLGALPAAPLAWGVVRSARHCRQRNGGQTKEAVEG